MFLCGKIKQDGDYFSLRKRITLKNMSRNFSTEKCISGIHKKLKSVCVCNMISPTRKPPQSSPPSLRICLRVLCLSHSLMGATLLLITAWKAAFLTLFKLFWLNKVHLSIYILTSSSSDSQTLYITRGQVCSPLTLTLPSVSPRSNSA